MGHLESGKRHPSDKIVSRLAEVLGLDAERVRCIGTDTRFTPYDRSTGASRSTTLAGLAVQRAAQQVINLISHAFGAITPIGKPST